APGTTICPGETATLTVENPQGRIVWFDTPMGGNALAEGASFTTSALERTTAYYVETTIEGGCTSTRRAVEVNVRPVTPAPVVQPVLLCGPGNTAVLLAEGNATSYEWFDAPAGGNSLSSDRTFQTPVLSESRSYYVQATIEGCVSPRTEAKVIVYPVITDNTLADIPTICAGQTPARIQGSTPAGGNGSYAYQWEVSSQGATEGFSAIDGANLKDYQPSPLSRTTWFRRKVTSASCTSTSEAIEVQVTPVISNNTIRPDGSTIICENSTADQISGSAPEGGNGSYTFAWETSTTGAEGVYSAARGVNHTQHYSPGSLTQTTWIRRRVSSGTCEVQVSQPVKITVYKPIAGNTISGESTICAAETPPVLQGSQPSEGDGNYTFRWEMSHNGTDFEAATGQHNTISYNAGPLTTTTWFRRVVSGGPCGVNISNVVKVTVNPVITNNVVAAVDPICSGTEAPVLSATAPQGGDGTYTFRWLYSTSGANGTYTAAPGNHGEANYTPGVLSRTTWYKREVSSGACTSVSAPVEVTVNALPVAPTVRPVTVCEHTTATLTVEESNGVFRWYTSATAQEAVFTGRSYTTAPLTGTTTFYVESVSTNGCGSPQRTAVTVTVNRNISNNTITAPATQPVCAGQAPGQISGTAPEGGNGSYTYRWERSTTSASDGFTAISGATGASYQPQELSTTTWFRRVAVSGPCAEQVSQAVKIEVVPVISNNSISAAQTICEGDLPAELKGTAPAGGDGTYTYLWQSSTDGSNFEAAAGESAKADYTAPTPLTQSTWYRRVVLSGPCAQDISAAVKITVHPTIAGNRLTTPEQTICAGEAPGILHGEKPSGGNDSYTYLWEMSTDNGATYTGAPGTRTNGSYQAPALTQTTWFRRKVVSGMCDSYSAPVKVTVHEVIAANEISESQEICIDTAPRELAGSQPTGGNGAYTFRWEYSTTGQPDSFVPVTANGDQRHYSPGIMTHTTWFRRVVTSGACSHVSNTVKVTVSAEITRNIVMISQSIYAGQVPAPLTGSAPAGGNGTYTYLWEMSEDGTSFSPAEVPSTGRNYAPKALTRDTWFRRVVYSGGCANVSDPIKISVTPAIGGNTIQADQIICYGNRPATLTGTTPAGGEGDYLFLWQQSTVGPESGWVTASGVSNTRDYTPAVLTQHTWFRRIVISGPNTDTSAPVMITVKPAMSNNKVSTSQTVCYNTAPTTLQGTLPTGGSGTYTYLWEMSTAGPDKGFTTAPGANNRQDYTPGALTQHTWFRRVVTSESCDRLVSEPVLMTVTPLPLAPVAQGTAICAGQTATLTATGKGGRLEWYASAAGGIPIAVGSTLTTPALHHTTTYYVQEVSQSCASVRQEVTVTVTEPTASAGQDVTIVKGRSIELQASGGVSYAWSPAAGLSKTDIANPMASPEVTTTYTVTVVTAGGCTFTDKVTVTVLPHVFIPNTFTPNRDGINDVWEILNIEKYPSCKVQVYNQWGSLVFTSDGYGEPWDGRQNGKELPIATYYYIIQLDKTEKPLSGSVTIVK
ncbi:MAG: gliding motility-associated C-terminal domain-containing protein, partial [Hymenobacteraceae bacterium]|nr:gliding motility-associated C-terminal domain-containing protein [Hymenobacteraceae bacterium]